MDQEQRLRLQRIAEARLWYIEWIAGRLLQTDDVEVRRAASALLLELVSSDVHEEPSEMNRPLRTRTVGGVGAGG